MSRLPESTRRGPLAGKRIIEVCHMLAGPYCGMLLADLGATVIKIETGAGDIARATGPHCMGPHNVYFASLNRGKRSVSLDLKDAADRVAFANLVRSADGLITNLRPDAIERLGLTYTSLRPINSRLVCVALTGFGLTGPFRDRPAYDYIIQALCGVMMLTGDPDAPPTRAGYSVVDNTGGMMAAIGLLAHLVSGRGTQLDISLYDVMLSQLNYLAAAYLNAGARPVRHPCGAHAYFVPAQIFATADGYLSLFITHDAFWGKFCIAVEKPEWLADERFATMHSRTGNRALVVDAISRLLRARTTAAWLELLQPLGIVIAGVRDLEQAINCEHTRARGMVVEVVTGQGILRLMGNPIKTDCAAGGFEPPPLLGQHSAEELATTIPHDSA
jgi:CoA:oxalate CoA-transferase